jgi:hypothetical protein
MRSLNRLHQGGAREFQQIGGFLVVVGRRVGLALNLA